MQRGIGKLLEDINREIRAKNEVAIKNGYSHSNELIELEDVKIMIERSYSNLLGQNMLEVKKENRHIIIQEAYKKNGEVLLNITIKGAKVNIRGTNKIIAKEVLVEKGIVNERRVYGPNGLIVEKGIRDLVMEFRREKKERSNREVEQDRELARKLKDMGVSLRAFSVIREKLSGKPEQTWKRVWDYMR